MLLRLMTKRIFRSFIVRKHVCRLCTEPGFRREHEYVFKKVRNDSIIRDFALGQIKPQFLKFPDGLQADTIVNSIISELDNLPTDMVEDIFFQHLKRIGLFGAVIPVRYGGLGLCMSHYVYLLEHERLIDWTLSLIAHQSMCAQALIQYGSEEQKNHYLPKLATGEMIGAFCLTENSSGSDMAALETTGILNAMEDHYVVDGTKNWVVNGAIADVIIVFVRTSDSTHEGGRQHMTALIIDKTTMPGITVANQYHVHCLPNSHLADVRFQSVFVPVTNVLYEDHGGYKIANHIQNNARCMIGPTITASLRLLIEDLIHKSKAGILDHDSHLRDLVNDSVSQLYAIESSLFFTTRYGDMYEVPDIELESAAVKVFSVEAAKQVIDNYLRIMTTIQCTVSPHMARLCDRVSYLQSFLGSNYFVRLYIGGTMAQLSEYTLLDVKEKLKSPVYNFSSLVEFVKTSNKEVNWSEQVTNEKYRMVVDRTVFLGHLNELYRKMQLSRMMLYKVMQGYREELIDHQHVVEAMSDIGILVYVVSCCVARANCNCGDYEVGCTHTMIEHARGIVDKSLTSLEITLDDCSKLFMAMMAEDIKQAGGYAAIDVLQLKDDGKADQVSMHLGQSLTDTQ